MKNQLQERLEAAGLPYPEYVEREAAGGSTSASSDPKVCSVECRVAGRVMGIGSGETFKAASTAAAVEALACLETCPLEERRKERNEPHQSTKPHQHPKTALNELIMAERVQGRTNLGELHYDAKDLGLHACPRWEVIVKLGARKLAESKGGSKKAASAAAAQEAYQLLLIEFDLQTHTDH